MRAQHPTEINLVNLKTLCEQRLPATLELLRAMVEINSFTANAAGVNRLGVLTAEAFAPLGFESSFVPAANVEYGDHLVLRRHVGTGRPTIALISHLDTVFTEEEERRNSFHWRVQGSRIYGPGTNDIKGGTVMIWLLLQVLREHAPALYDSTNWVVLLNACEEVKSIDFGELCRAELPADTLGCLVFEGDGGSGDLYSIVEARKGRATFDVHVSGRGAHAGSSHQQGSNAVVQLAKIITELDQLTDYAQGVTVNIGSVTGGTVPNRVPHEAAARLEMRAFSAEIFAQTRDAILAKAGEGSVRSAADGHPCQITVSMDDESCPWPPNAATDRLIRLWRETAGELDLNLAIERRGGLSDGNMIWDAFPTIDGLGPRGENCHCSEQSEDGSKEQEWVDVDSIVPKTVLNAICVLKILGQASPQPSPGGSSF